MNDDLVEKVIDAMSNCGSETVGSRMGRAAIAVVLEEAAKVCDAIETKLSDQWSANTRMKLIPTLQKLSQPPLRCICLREVLRAFSHQSRKTLS